MDKIFLSEPQKEYQTSFQAYAKAYERINDNDYYNKYKPALKNFEEFLISLHDCSLGNNLSPGDIAATSFWLIAQNEVVGVVRIRHEEDPTAGHIGYDISPDFRNKGYGNMILTLALEKAKAFKLNEVVITCNTENTVSKKIIENHGGKFLGIIYDEEEDEHLYKYVI